MSNQKQKKEVVKKLPKIGTKAHKKLKWKESIDVINRVITCRIGVSDIHGVGVIALKDIPKGQKLQIDGLPEMFDVPYSMAKNIDKPIRDMILEQFPLWLEGSPFLAPVSLMSAHLNHSDDPNYDAVNDKTLKDIKAGEEITEDYRKVKGHELVYKFLKINK